MANRLTAPDRMRRVLAVVPWIVANPGHYVGDVADRFGLAKEELLDDLHVVFMVGLPPYSPDALVDVQIDDEGRVTIRLADFFSRPLRLTPGQGLALLASSDGLLSIPGTEPGGALERALAKLGEALGVGADQALDVHLGPAEASMLDQFREAATTRREVAMSYYSYGRDERSERVIAPWRVFAESGAWYVHAWCNRAEGERLFRIDRVEEMTVLETESSHRPSADDHDIGVFQPQPDDPRVTLALSPEGRWVADYYPVEIMQSNPDGSSVVELVVAATPWLQRLLIRLGPDGSIVSSTGLADADALAQSTASKILSRYRP